MHPWHKRDMLRWMRETAEGINKAAERLENRKPEDLSFSVGWGSNGVVVMLDERPLTRGQVEEIAVGAIWALFESARDGGDPGDPETFAKVRERITGMAAKRCWQRDEPCTAKATGDTAEKKT